jgi:hypothetical protein
MEVVGAAGAEAPVVLLLAPVRAALPLPSFELHAVKASVARIAADNIT